MAMSARGREPMAFPPRGSPTFGEVVSSFNRYGNRAARRHSHMSFAQQTRFPDSKCTIHDKVACLRDREPRSEREARAACATPRQMLGPQRSSRTPSPWQSRPRSTPATPSGRGVYYVGGGKEGHEPLGHEGGLLEAGGFERAAHSPHRDFCDGVPSLGAGGSSARGMEAMGGMQGGFGDRDRENFGGHADWCGPPRPRGPEAPVLRGGGGGYNYKSGGTITTTAASDCVASSADRLGLGSRGPSAERLGCGSRGASTTDLGVGERAAVAAAGGAAGVSRRGAWELVPPSLGGGAGLASAAGRSFQQPPPPQPQQLPPQMHAHAAPQGAREASFLRLNAFLLRTHITSLLSALAEDGWLEAWEKERLCRYARDDGGQDNKPWALAFLRAYARFTETGDVQAFVADLRAQVA
eukprot:TRINITY_DN10407_c0_g1_i2.p1 TRINITY_DN10407_c0_g1~~TRINITY_DN10407_c0_g1_i2.p1  ORF type:complete len:411 (+),score=72.73 TRINITY_DN10407_c0_g1_i2:205-1437(+)